MIQIKEATTADELKFVFAIREQVFVQEQQVPRHEEYDEFEDTAHHYLALYNGQPCGTARWRKTDKGVKLERFAVLSEFRNNQIGAAILQRVLADVKARTKAGPIYLHAQLPAMRLYERAGFAKQGELFLECDIEHYKMVLHR